MSENLFKNETKSINEISDFFARNKNYFILFTKIE